MDVNSLLYDELSYELWIRSITLNASILEKRKILRLLLQQEEDLFLSAGKPFKFNFAIELTVCKNKLNEIDTEIKNFNSINIHNKFKRIISRLCHIESRLRRLTLQDKTSNKHLQILKQLCLISVELVDNAYEIEKITLVSVNEVYFDHTVPPGCSGAPYTNLDFMYPSTNAQILPEAREEETSPQPNNIAFIFSHVHNKITEVVQDGFKQGQFYSQNWSISYNGTTDVNDFLNVIETLRLMHNVSKKQLFAAASSFFKDDALLWYKSRKHILHNWDYLTIELARSFSTVYDDNRLWQYISSRYQGENEKLIFYIASIEHLLQRLIQVPTELERVNIIQRNLLPPIKAALLFHEIYTLDQLLKIGRTVEKCYWFQNQYRFDTAP